MANFRSDSIDTFFRAVLALKDREECYSFFEDVCTVKEIQDMAQRFEAAVMLDEGANYQAITKKIGLSTATIGRVSRCLKYGAGGYSLAIERMKNGEKDDAEQ